MATQASPHSSSLPVFPQATTEPRPAACVHAARSKTHPVGQTRRLAALDVIVEVARALYRCHRFRPTRRAQLPTAPFRPKLANL
jgi:hypothetical protein